MPTFTYKGFAGTKAVSGTLEAADRRLAARKLQAKGIRPSQLRAKSGKGVGPSRLEATRAEPVEVPKESTKKSAFSFLRRKKQGVAVSLPYFRKLLQLHANGMSAGDALHLMSQRMNEPSLKAVSEQTYRDLSEGRTLATSMRAQPEFFTDTQSHLIEAGEATGNLTPILSNLIHALETQEELKKKVRSAMAYPAFLCVFAFGVVGLFLFYLLPQIQQMLSRLGGELNLAVRLLIGFSDFAFNQGPFVLAILLGLAIALIRWRKTERGKYESDVWLLRLPLIGSIIRHGEVNRMANVLQILLGNGVNTTESLRLAGAVVQNEVYRERFQAARTLINDGAPFSTAFQRYGLLPPMDVDILGIGESTGNLVNSFAEIDRTHGEALQDRLRFGTNLLAGMALGFAFSLVVIITLGIVLSVMDMSNNILA